jgi:hypothetical protein
MPGYFWCSSPAVRFNAGHAVGSLAARLLNCAIRDLNRTRDASPTIPRRFYDENVIRLALRPRADVSPAPRCQPRRRPTRTVTLTIYKAGWVIGGSGGGGTLRPCCAAASATSAALDVAGVYGAAGGPRGGRGARAIVLTNQKGAVLELTGQQVGLMANADERTSASR